MTTMIDCTQVLDEDDLNAATYIGRLKVGNLEINGQCYDIYTGENVIGRDDLSDIVIRSASISNKHAVIEVEDWETHFIFDCGSTNKTRLGRVLLKPNARYELQERNDIMFANLTAKYIKLARPHKIIPDNDDSGSETGSESMLNCEPDNNAGLDFEESSPLKVVPGQNPEDITNRSESFNLNESSIFDENRKNSSSNNMQVVEASMDDSTDDEDDLFVLPSQTVKEFNSNRHETKFVISNKISNQNILTEDVFSCSENKVVELNNSKDIFEMETQEQEEIPTNPKDTSMNMVLDVINTELVFSSEIERGPEEQNPKNVDISEAETELYDNAVDEQNRRQENYKVKEGQFDFFEAATQLNDNEIRAQKTGNDTDNGKSHLFNAEDEQNRRQKNDRVKEDQFDFFEAETQLNDNEIRVQKIGNDIGKGKSHLFNAEDEQNLRQERGLVDFCEADTELNCKILITEDNERSKNSKMNVSDNETEKNGHGVLTKSNNKIDNVILNCNLISNKSIDCFQDDLDMSELALSRVTDENAGNEISCENVPTQVNANLVKDTKKTSFNVNYSGNLTNKSNQEKQNELDKNNLNGNALDEQHLESADNYFDAEFCEALTQVNYKDNPEKVIPQSLKPKEIVTYTVKKEENEDSIKQESLSQSNQYEVTCKHEKDIDDLNTDAEQPNLDLHNLFAEFKVENSPDDDDFANAETQPYIIQKTPKIEKDLKIIEPLVKYLPKVEPTDNDKTTSVSEFVSVQSQRVDIGTISKPSAQKSTSKIISEKALNIRRNCVSELADIQSSDSLNITNQGKCNKEIIVNEDTSTKSTITIDDMEICSTIDDNMYISKLSTSESAKKEEACTKSSAKKTPLHSKCITNSSVSLNCSNNKVDAKIIKGKSKMEQSRSNNTMFTGPCSSSTPLRTIDVGNDVESSDLNLKVHQGSVQTPTKEERIVFCDSPILPSTQELLAVADKTPAKNRGCQSELTKNNLPLSLSKTPRIRKPSRKLSDDFDAFSNDVNKGNEITHNQEQEIFRQNKKNHPIVKNNIDNIINVEKNTILNTNNETKLVADVYKEYGLKNVVIKLKKSKISNKSSKQTAKALRDELLNQEKGNTSEHNINKFINVDSKDTGEVIDEDNSINTDKTHTMSTKPKNKKLICPPNENKISSFDINEQTFNSKEQCLTKTKKKNKDTIFKLINPVHEKADLEKELSPSNEECKHLRNKTVPLALLYRTSRTRKPPRKYLDELGNNVKKSIDYLPLEQDIAREKNKNDLGLTNNNSNLTNIHKNNTVADSNVESNPFVDIEKESKLDALHGPKKFRTPSPHLKEINKSKQTKQSYKSSKQATNKLSNNEIAPKQEKDQLSELKSKEILNSNPKDSITMNVGNHFINTYKTTATSSKHEDECSFKVNKIMCGNSNEEILNFDDQFVSKRIKENIKELSTHEELLQEKADQEKEPLLSNEEFKHLEEQASIVKKTPKYISQEPVNNSTSKKLSDKLKSIGTTKSQDKNTPTINTRSKIKKAIKCGDAEPLDNIHISQVKSESPPRKSKRIITKYLVSKDKDSSFKPIMENDNVDKKPKRNFETISINELLGNTSINTAESSVALKRSKRGKVREKNVASEKEVPSEIIDSHKNGQESYEKNPSTSRTDRGDLKDQLKLDPNKNNSSSEIKPLLRNKRKLKVGTEPLKEGSHLKHLKLSTMNEITEDTHIIDISSDESESKSKDNIEMSEDKSTSLQAKRQTRKRLTSLQDKEDTLPPETTVNTSDTSSAGRKQINKPSNSVDSDSRGTERKNRKMNNDKPVFAIPTKSYSRKKEKNVINQLTPEVANTIKSPKTPIKIDNREMGKRSRSRSDSISSQDSTDSRFGTPRRSSIKREQILFTCLSDPSLEAIIKKLGGKVVDCPRSCSILVTDKVRRTVKFLCSLGQGKPIVTSEWINQSMRCMRFQDPMEFLLKDPEAEQRFQFTLAQSLQGAKRRLLLTGYSVHATPSVKPPPEEIKNIIECCGGVYLEKVPSKWPDQCLVISHPEDRSLWKKFKVKGITPPIVAVEMILLGVLQQKLDVETHKLL